MGPEMTNTPITPAAATAATTSPATVDSASAAGPAGLNYGLLIDIGRMKITVAEHAYNPFACQSLQVVRIRRKIPCVQPELRSLCPGMGQHILKPINIAVTVADYSDLHNFPQSSAELNNVLSS